MSERTDWKEVAGRAEAHAAAQETRRVRSAQEELAVAESRAFDEREATMRTSRVLQEIMLTCQAIATIFNDAVTNTRLSLQVLEETGKRPLLYSFTVRRGDDCHEIQVLLNGCDEICINSDLGLHKASGQTLKFHINERSQLNRKCGAEIYTPYEVGKHICEQLIDAPLVP